jgi:hypothetical protein
MLQKQAIDISFAKGLDTKTDKKRVQIGSFLKLENSIFDKAGLLTKRNGYSRLASLPASNFSYLTTLNDGLVAVGSTLASYTESTQSWTTKSTILQPVKLGVTPLVRNNFNQSSCDSVTAPNGLVCTTFLESTGSGVANKYTVSEAATGQNVIPPTLITVTSGAVSGGMRVFLLGGNFVIVFTNTIVGTAHLQYIAISLVNPSIVTANADIASSYVPASTLAFDGFVAGGNLYLAYNTTSGGQQSVQVTYLTSALHVVTPATFAGQIGTMFTVTADTTAGDPIVYASWYDSVSQTGYVAVLDHLLNVLVAPAETIGGPIPALNLASAAQNGVCRIFAEISNAYGFDTLVPTNFIETFTVTPNIPLGTAAISSPVVSIRSVGIASKAFIVDGTVYVLSAFQSPYQPTYFLINGSRSTATAPVIVAKLAYSNGGGYLTTGLPSVSLSEKTASISYLYKDTIQAVNKNTNVSAGQQTAGIYSQTGINLATFDLAISNIDSAEIGHDLHVSGGFLWMYDGNTPVEHDFFLWPDTDLATPLNNATYHPTGIAGGAMHDEPIAGTSTNQGAYYYQFVYEWTDNEGNAFRSAPSIPVAVATGSGTGTTGAVVLNIPTLRVTMKTANPVKIVIYRWSVGQPIYYQVTSITTPLLNNTTVDRVTFTDPLADASILGNNILYTTGGVVEDINAPATNLMTLFDTRLWLVDAEDQNLLWFSKQVIEAVPVEMSDLLTMYIAPTTGAQGSTGPITALSVMDDKLIIFKKNAIYYVNGTGPDNTGANNQYSQPIFVTSTVGCANQGSVVFMPNGLMFQSDKGIWLLDRSLNTSYIGAPVEDLTRGAAVESAQNIPATNQVRFILSSGVTLMYDYYFSQWGTFTGVPALSSCIFQGLHTFIDTYGRAFQESEGAYLDGDLPVQMSFTTGPIRLDALQAYQRAYFFYLLGEYLSPHKLVVSVAYDYSPNPSQQVIIQPTNFQPVFGGIGPFGAGPFGGVSLENWRVFLERQRCQAFSISVQEIFDPSFGVPAGAGFTLSGINAVCGFKKGFAPLPASQSIG